MEDRMIAGKALKEWIQENPQLIDIILGDEIFWSNPNYDTFDLCRYNKKGQWFVRCGKAARQEPANLNHR